MKIREKVAVLTGAGVSAESGLSTFRDAGGLWEGHDVMEVASPVGWRKNPKLVLEFYNMRRKQLLLAQPNAAHSAIADLEATHDVTVITQNIDDLHERGGSTNVIHLHGELLKARSEVDPDKIYDWKTDLNLGDLCDSGGQLRPHVVWFGEEVPMIPVAAEVVSQSDIVIIVGTSMQVYPAAGLVSYARAEGLIFYVDPNPSITFELSLLSKLEIIEKTASIGVPQLVEQLANRS